MESLSENQLFQAVKPQTEGQEPKFSCLNTFRIKNLDKILLLFLLCFSFCCFNQEMIQTNNLFLGLSSCIRNVTPERSSKALVCSGLPYCCVQDAVMTVINEISRVVADFPPASGAVMAGNGGFMHSLSDT